MLVLSQRRNDDIQSCMTPGRRPGLQTSDRSSEEGLALSPQSPPRPHLPRSPEQPLGHVHIRSYGIMWSQSPAGGPCCLSDPAGYHTWH